MAEPEPNHGWHLPDGSPAAPAASDAPPDGRFAAPDLYLTSPRPEPMPDRFRPPEPGPPVRRLMRPGPVLAVLAGVAVLVACVGAYGYALNQMKNRVTAPPPTRPTKSVTARRSAPATQPTTQPGTQGIAQLSGVTSAGSARKWVLVSPAKAGVLRRSADTPTVTAARARQRQAGVTDPYAAAYEDALDPQYWVLVTGQVGARFTTGGPLAAVTAWLAIQDAVHASGPDWDDSMFRGDPPAIGGEALCRSDYVQDVLVAWCGWAAEGVIVQFVFQQMPVAPAWDRMTEMLPDLVTWT